MAGTISYEDFSGSTSASLPSTSSNPYDALISACLNDPSQIQARYALHRTTRNTQQKAALLSASSPTPILREPVLRALLSPLKTPDPRHCLVLWARPPPRLISLIQHIQTTLTKLAPHIWAMPGPSLHMTALELAHSRSAEEIDALVAAMEPHLPRILAHTRSHRTRLVKPLLSYDATALALSLVPVAEGPGAEYTYHHLRRDLHDLCTTASLPIASRYVIPSAHISILRFVSSADHSEGGVDTDGAPTDPQKMQRWVTEIERLNGWLEEKFWGQGEGEGEGKGEGEKEKGLDWVVGEGVGLDCRRGTVWYGGGETVALGEGS